MAKMNHDFMFRKIESGAQHVIHSHLLHSVDVCTCYRVSFEPLTYIMSNSTLANILDIRGSDQSIFILLNTLFSLKLANPYPASIEELAPLSIYLHSPSL